MENQLHVHPSESYTDPEIERFVEEKHNQLHQAAILLGKSQASANQPPLIGGSLSLYASTTVSGYNLLLNQALGRIDVSLQVRSGSAERQKMEARIKGLQAEADKEEMQQALDSGAKPAPVESANQKVKSAKSKLVLGIIVISCICLGDIWFMGLSLQVLGKSLFGSFCIGVAVVVSFLAIGFFSEKWIERTRSILLKRLIRLGVILLIITCLLFLSIIRSEYQEKMYGNSSSFWSFLTLSVLFFLGVFLIEQFWVIPAIEELQAARALQREEEKERRKRARLEQARAQLNDAIDQLHNYLKLKVKIITYAENMKNRIIKLYHLSMSHYRHSNMERRNGVPDCFNGPDPELDISPEVSIWQTETAQQ